MRVLVACEESQAVVKEFRRLGHEAYSCDIQECSGGVTEYHLQVDALQLLKIRWDMIIAFPPCTHLAVSGAAWFEEKRNDGRQREAIEFFCSFLYANCERIAVENPINIISSDYVPKWFPDLAEKYNLPQEPTQIIQPWMFGDNFEKSTCLWLRGLPKLKAEVTTEPPLEWFEWTAKKTGIIRRQPKWYAEAWRLPAEERSRVRSKTFPGIARAMAEQWGGENRAPAYVQSSLFEFG